MDIKTTECMRVWVLNSWEIKKEEYDDWGEWGMNTNKKPKPIDKMW